MQTVIHTRPERAQAPSVAVRCAPIRKILVIVNSAAIRHACVEKAALIAAHAGSTIELFVCDVESSLPNSWVGDGDSSRTYRQLLRKRRLDDVEQIADGIRASGLHTTVAAEWHAMNERGIKSHVAKTNPDLVIKDASLRGMLTRSTGPRVGWVLTHQIAPSVLLVHAKPWPVHPVIAAGVELPADGEALSSLDEWVIESSQSLTEALEGTLFMAQRPRRANDMAALTGAHNASILAVGAGDRSQEGCSLSAPSTAQILDKIECDLLIVKTRV